MDNNKFPSKYKRRKKFIIGILNKVASEYKSLLEISRRKKAFKIIGIAHLSHLPQKTKFILQVTNKKCMLKLSAIDIFNSYSLENFNELHAELIRRAIQGTLIEFLDSLNDNKPLYKITSKKFDRNLNQYVFTIQSKIQNQFVFTAKELSSNKYLLENMNLQDVYDIGHTQGTETVLNEKSALLLAKPKKL